MNSKSKWICLFSLRNAERTKQTNLTSYRCKIFLCSVNIMIYSFLFNWYKTKRQLTAKSYLPKEGGKNLNKNYKEIITLDSGRMPNLLRKCSWLNPLITRLPDRAITTKLKNLRRKIFFKKKTFLQGYSGEAFDHLLPIKKSEGINFLGKKPFF